MKLHRYLLHALFVALLAAAPMAMAADSSASDDHASPPIPQAFKTKTVVFVHGFFADGSGWKSVIERLQALHINVVAVQNPLISLAGDVEATRRVVDRLPGEVVLVGHSYGGFVITNAGLNPKVVSLVYVAAFAPEVGESVNTLLSGYPPAPWGPDLIADDAGDLTMTSADYVKYFAPDLPRRQAMALSAVQVGPAAAGFAEPAVAAAWQARPSWYVLTLDDQMIDPNLQKFMSARINAKVTSVHSSHSVMLSHPDLVTEVILEAFLSR